MVTSKKRYANLSEWVFTAKVANASVEGDRIEVKAYDLPVNSQLTFLPYYSITASSKDFALEEVVVCKDRERM